MTALANKKAELDLKSQRWLNEMREIDAQLSRLTPADPTRHRLKGEKERILGLYREARGEIKALNRLLNNTSPGVLSKALEQPQEESNDALDELYKTLSQVYDSVMDNGITYSFNTEELQTIKKFLDYMDDKGER